MKVKSRDFIFAERVKFIGIPHWRKVHLRFQLRYILSWFSEKRNKSFNEAKRTWYSSREETSCIDMNIIRNAMADSIRINDRSL